MKLIYFMLATLVPMGLYCQTSTSNSSNSSGGSAATKSSGSSTSGPGLWTCSDGCSFTQESDIITHIQNFKAVTVPVCMNMLNKNLTFKGCTELEVFADKFKTKCLDKFTDVHKYVSGAESRVVANNIAVIRNQELEPFSTAVAKLQKSFDKLSSFEWAGSDATAMKSCAKKNCKHSLGSIAGTYSLACLFRECETGSRASRGTKLAGYINALSKVAEAQIDLMTILSHKVSGQKAPQLASFRLPSFIHANTFHYPTNYDMQIVLNAGATYNRTLNQKIQALQHASSTAALSPLTTALINSLTPIHKGMIDSYKNIENNNVAHSCKVQSIDTIVVSLVIGFLHISSNTLQELDFPSRHCLKLLKHGL